MISARNLAEMIVYPWSNLRKIQNLDRRPDMGRAFMAPYPPEKQKSKDPIERGSRSGDWVENIVGSQRELSRLEYYAVYREMDMDPMISAVLDAFSEEATQRDFETGRTVWVTSPNEDVKKIVLRCLDRIGMEDAAFPIVRAFGKYGDCFESVISSRNAGVQVLKPYDPWDVARIEDDLGRLEAFAPCDSTGKEIKVDTHSVPFYKALHYRLLGRERKNIYGSSLLWGSREKWRQLQLIEDQIVLQRLLRRPDRLLILMDVGGMSLPEAYEACKEWEDRIYFERNVDPVSGLFTASGAPWHEARDMILPLGTDNNTRIENLPATSSNDLFRDYELILSRLLGGLHIPKGYLGFEGAYEPNTSLGKQDVRFAKTVMRLQRAFLVETVRACMIDLAFHNLDPFDPKHSFRLHMAPISAFMEIERSELLQMRVDVMDRMLRLGQDAQFNTKVWIPYVLEEIGQFPKDMIDELISGGGGEGGEGTFESIEEMREHVKDNPELASKLTFLSEGMGMVHSRELHDTKETSKAAFKQIKEAVESAKKKGEKETDPFEGVLQPSTEGADHVRAEAVARAERRVKALRGVSKLPVLRGVKA